MAAANHAGTLRVWYRSSDGCPDGTRFIEQLARLGREASLASVGDRVDFVVTLAHTPALSRGRLERQSQERTVAIRDVESASCEDVAGVLALSLELSLQPGASPPADTATATEADSAPSVAALEPAASGDAWSMRLGAQGRIESGLAYTLLPGAALFAELAPRALGPSARLSLRGAHAVRELDVSLNLTLVAARPEACMYWGSGTLRGGPCAGVEVGLVFAHTVGERGEDDRGLWSSGVGLVRGDWELGRGVSLEAQLGGLVPFVRYRFNTQSGRELSSSAAIGVEAALGMSFLLGG